MLTKKKSVLFTILTHSLGMWKITKGKERTVCTRHIRDLSRSTAKPLQKEGYSLLGFLKLTLSCMFEYTEITNCYVSCFAQIFFIRICGMSLSFLSWQSSILSVSVSSNSSLTRSHLLGLVTLGDGEEREERRGFHLVPILWTINNIRIA